MLFFLYIFQAAKYSYSKFVTGLIAFFGSFSSILSNIWLRAGIFFSKSGWISEKLRNSRVKTLVTRYQHRQETLMS